MGSAAKNIVWVLFALLIGAGVYFYFTYDGPVIDPSNKKLTATECTQQAGEVKNTLNSSDVFDEEDVVGIVTDMDCPCVCVVGEYDLDEPDMADVAVGEEYYVRNIDEPEGPSVDVEELISGEWQSVDDPLAFKRIYRNKTIEDGYDGKVISSGKWGVTREDPLPTMWVEVDGETEVFTILSVDMEELQLSTLRGNTLTYVRILK